MAAQAGLCLIWSETPEDTFYRVVAHIVCAKRIHGNFEYNSEKCTPAFCQKLRSVVKKSVLFPAATFAWFVFKHKVLF